MTEKPTELLPCPFCGLSDHVSEIDIDECEDILVTCQRCEASTWKDKWNTRAAKGQGLEGVE